jgi:hypothetical protein
MLTTDHPSLILDHTLDLACIRSSGPPFATITSICPPSSSFSSPLPFHCLVSSDPLALLKLSSCLRLLESATTRGCGVSKGFLPYANELTPHPRVVADSNRRRHDESFNSARVRSVVWSSFRDNHQHLSTLLELFLALAFPLLPLHLASVCADGQGRGQCRGGVMDLS